MRLPHISLPVTLPITFLLLLLLLFQQPTHAQRSTVTITVSAPTPTPSTYLSSSLFESTILNSTNTYRYQNSAPAIIWNTTLSTIAQKYSSNCHFAESGTSGIGENLAEGYSDTIAAVDAWGNERKLYDYSSPGYSDSTGHFTQLVWKATTSTGCGATFCNGTNGVGGWLLVCEYYPAGNVVGSGSEKDVYFEENVGTQTETGTLPSGWTATATPSATTTTTTSATAGSATTTTGLTVIPASASSMATVTVGSTSAARSIYGYSEYPLRSHCAVWGVTIAAATVVISMGFI